MPSKPPRGAALAAVLTLAALASALQDPAPAPPSKDAGARELFVFHCAACHGEKGDGEGVTQLDRKARSFLDGGFSYGNTPTAIGRSIAGGIPGTPMPGFDAALSKEQRARLVEYVISLGPERREVDPKETVMVVADRPLVVRGHLPPIAEGAKAHPRGLLIGLPTGTTFQYRVDDVRLLGVRQGDFVERRDWSGRGGDALGPLGKIVHLVDEGKPGPTFERSDGRTKTALSSRLSGTWIEGRDAGLTYDVIDTGGVRLCSVNERVATVSTAVGSGFRRDFRITGGETEALVEVRTRRGATSSETGVRESSATHPERHVEIAAIGDSLFRCTGIRFSSPDSSLLDSPPITGWRQALRSGSRAEVSIFTIVAVEDPDVPALLREIGW